ncbi:Asp-tRNA(Asn)/Glu-tRNA(Gln) amidotransferase subunit GatB [Candidatus Pacearchaeota archaeon]|nr:Asp-tRNA(Asn)/Glu-tRNA(Gln) amidotransferase subunit GatB [Candidatus Pacearchaeota archaeon]
MNNKEIKNILIGLEIHGYIETKEKLFCRCRNFHDMKVIKPNMNVCPICTGQPGTKPMLPNSSAIDKILEIALMLHGKPNIIEEKKLILFQRKHYDWPDMPYGYQRTISGAYSIPVAEQGLFEGIRIREVHLEEDPASWDPKTGEIDYNRAGVPLVEIVTEPDFKNGEEIDQWLKKLILTLSYIKALNKDAGIKADVNINIRGMSERTEIKNVNSIREIVKAIGYEIERHLHEKPVKRETRRWNSLKDKTELMREKEEQADYRFIPDPDLPVIKITKAKINYLKGKLPESPMEKLGKIIRKYHLNREDAEVLTKNLEVVELFEEVSEKISPALALPWITVEWLSVLNYNKKTMDDIEVRAEHFIELLSLLEKGKITPLKAKDILRKFVPKSFSPSHEAEKSMVIDNKKELINIIKKVLNDNKSLAEDYKKGEKKTFNFLMGQVMKETGKRADYKTVIELLKKELEI